MEKGLILTQCLLFMIQTLNFIPKAWGNHKFMLKIVTQIPLLESQLWDQCKKQAAVGRSVQKLRHILGKDVGYTLSVHQ